MLLAVLFVALVPMCIQPGCSMPDSPLYSMRWCSEATGALVATPPSLLLLQLGFAFALAVGVMTFGERHVHFLPAVVRSCGPPGWDPVDGKLRI